MAAAELPEHYFDLAICNDVIEHVPDHDLFLESIKSKLVERDRLVGSIANVRHFTTLFRLLALKDWHYSDCGILDRTHLRFFTAGSLRRSLREHGYVIERFGGVSLGYYWDTLFR